MKNIHIIIENNLAYVVLYQQKNYSFFKKNSKRMVIEMLLNNDIQIFFGSNDLNFQKKEVIMYINFLI
jgi:hypothetical protein